MVGLSGGAEVSAGSDFEELVSPPPGGGKRTARSERDLLFDWLKQTREISIVRADGGGSVNLDPLELLVETLDFPRYNLALLLSPRLSEIIEAAIQDASKVEISFPVPGSKPHSHLLRLTQASDGAFLIATEDKERRGVRKDGRVLSDTTQGRFDPETRLCSEIIRTSTFEGWTVVERGPIKQNPVSMAVLYLWHAFSTDGATVKIYPKDGGRAQLMDINNERPNLRCLRELFFTMIGEFKGIG